MRLNDRRMPVSARLAIWLAPFLALGACAGGLPVAQDVIVSGARFEAVRGEASLFARTYLQDPNGDLREVGGAKCKMTSILFSAEFQTPARLVLPNFGPQSPELNFTCTAGDLSGQGTRSINTYMRGGYGGYPGLYGYPGFYGGGWGPGWGMYAPSYPVSDYRNVDMILR
jgi:hypothetical protein